MPLTDLQIRKAEPRAVAYKLSDGEGLYILIKPNKAKLWQMKYRYAGKEKTLSIGKYPYVTLAGAREKRSEAKKLLIEGIDPTAKKKENKLLLAYATRNTFKAVAQEWHDTKKDNWTPEHAERLWRRLELYAFPDLGNRPIASIKTPELISLLRKYEKCGKLETIYRLAQTFNVVFRYAVHCGVIEQNPANDLRGVLKPYKTVHFPTIGADEVPSFFGKLADVVANVQNKLAIRLLMLTFLRPGELRKAKWAEIDFEAKQWNIPLERMKRRKPHMVPLCDQALVLLYQLKELTGYDAYMFPSQHRRKNPYMSENTINHALRRMGYKGKLVGHGFRALASTILNDQGHFRKDAIEVQLSHTDEDKIRATYNRAEYLVERTKMMQWWGDYLDSAASAKVIAGNFKKASNA